MCDSKWLRSRIYFDCEKGVRQQENLSPLLFAIFRNNFKNFLDTNGSFGMVIAIEL